jgi:riboflavin synthase
VQGHVSSTAAIRELYKTDKNVYLSVEVPNELLRLCVLEGSITLDGISLTIAKISGAIITVNIIPTTYEETTLKFKKVGDYMNLETDIIGRYVERYLTPFLTEEKLAQFGL